MHKRLCPECRLASICEALSTENIGSGRGCSLREGTALHKKTARDEPMLTQQSEGKLNNPDEVEIIYANPSNSEIQDRAVAVGKLN